MAATTPEQLQQWMEMRRQGMSFRCIAEHQDVGEAQVRYAIQQEHERMRLAGTHACRWRDDGEAWWTDCGEAHTFFTDGPAENYHRYCPYCGRVIEEVEYARVD